MFDGATIYIKKYKRTREGKEMEDKQEKKTFADYLGLLIFIVIVIFIFKSCNNNEKKVQLMLK